MSKVLQWAIIISLGGFLFGFDTAVISGAEQSIQQTWGLSDLMHGFAIAVALYGTLIGAIFGDSLSIFLFSPLTSSSWYASTSTASIIRPTPTELSITCGR